MPQCTAKSKRSGERCKRHAAKDSRVCYMHGAKGGGPRPGNKSAVTHGGYETIFADSLTDDERGIWGSIPLDVAKQIDEELQLITIRERRMMQRIANFTGVDFTVVQQTHEIGVKEKGPVDFLTSVSEGSLGQVLKIESELTRVQAQKARLIDLKHKLIQDAEGDELDKLVAAIDASRERIEAAGDEA